MFLLQVKIFKRKTSVFRAGTFPKTVIYIISLSGEEQTQIFSEQTKMDYFGSSMKWSRKWTLIVATIHLAAAEILDLLPAAREARSAMLWSIAAEEVTLLRAIILQRMATKETDNNQRCNSNSINTIKTKYPYGMGIMEIEAVRSETMDMQRSITMTTTCSANFIVFSRISRSVGD